MVYRPEDRKKLMILGGAILLILLYGGLFAIPRWLAARGPLSKPAVKAVSASLPGASAAGSAQALTPAVADEVAGDPAAPTTDPFMPPVGVNPAPKRDTVLPAAKRAPGPAPAPVILPKAAQVQPVAVPMSAQAAALARPVAPQPPIQLKGVILGERPIAVVSIQGQVYQKRERERLPNGLMVTRITEAGIQLKGGNRRIAIEVGHSYPPVKPGMESGVSALPVPAEAQP